MFGLTGVMGTATDLQPSDSRKCFTREDYHAIGKAGILAPEDRVELLEGEVIVHVSDRQSSCRLRRPSSVQNPLAESDVSEPQPDYDLNTKGPFCARAGIREVWIVDLEPDRIEVHTEPAHRGYGFVRRFVPGDVLAPSALPEVTLEVARIIPARLQA